MVEPWGAITAGALLLASIMVLVFHRRSTRAVRSCSPGGDRNSDWVGRVRIKLQGSPAAMVGNAAVLAAMAALVFFAEQGRCWFRVAC